MYTTINKKPSKEEIATYNMKVSEGDTVIDYRIELDSLEQTVKEALCESYNLNEESLNNATKVILSFNTEV